MQVRILLWNVWLLPQLLSPSPRIRAGLISQHIKDQDIVVLNEAFTYKDILSQQAGYNYSVTLNQKCLLPWCFRPIDSGLLIFSKYPFDKVVTEMYESRGGVDRFSAKGIIMIRVTIDGIELDVYGTHMQSQPSSKRRAERLAEARQLAAFINLHSGKETKRHIVVAGDMNMGPLTDTNSYDWAYEDLIDKLVRTATYTRLKEWSGLEDAQYEDPYWQQDINWFLVRNVKGIVHNVGKPMGEVKGKMVSLSDSERYVFSAEIERDVEFSATSDEVI